MCRVPPSPAIVLLVAWGLPPLAAAGELHDAGALANHIDARLEVLCAEAGVRPSPIAEDAPFLRRTMLDLNGRIPTVAEIREFVADGNPDKRRAVVERLTENAAFTRHFGLFLRRAWLPQTDVEPHDHLSTEADLWIAGQLQRREPYDRIVRRLLLADQAGSGDSAAPAETPVGAETRVFQRANDHRPDLLTANAARSFLGIGLDCAECHDHPFERWSRDDFWRTAAFFARPTIDSATATPRLEIAVGDLDRRVTPAFLTGEPVDWPETFDAETGRRVLADWLTASDNPYFDRNVVNRVWAEFLGAGIVEPLDDLSGGEIVDDELLDLLADGFHEGGRDLRFLVRAIVLSRAYQRSSSTDVSPPAIERATSPMPTFFARASVRGLTGEQLYDSLRIATGHAILREDLDPTSDLSERRRFAERFRVARASEAERSILQSLTLMNGPLTASLTDPRSSPTVVAVADSPFLGPRERIGTLFLAVLGREPTAAELETFSPLAAEPDGVADVFWALLNSAEFNTNH